MKTISMKKLTPYRYLYATDSHQYALIPEKPY